MTWKWQKTVRAFGGQHLRKLPSRVIQAGEQRGRAAIIMREAIFIALKMISYYIKYLGRPKLEVVPIL